MNKARRFRLVPILFVAFLGALGVAGYKAYTVFYDQILELPQTWHLKVEEMRGTSDLQLEITTGTTQSAPVIRKVTIQRHDREITILYHLAISGLAKPTLNWGEPYRFTVPDSVDEVRFGKNATVIWHRVARKN